MNRIEKLLNEYCSNGVQYSFVEELCDISRGKVISKDYIRDNQGDYPVYSSQTENNGELGRISTYSYDGEYVTWTTDGANAGSVFYRNGKFSITNVCGLLKTHDIILARFLFYVLIIEAPKYVQRGMGNPKLMSNMMAKVKVPVPPLEVQEEIVKVLDDFTKLTTELTSELMAELTARKQQYSFYLNHFFENSSAMAVPLSSLGTLTRGKRFVHADATDDGVPCIHYGELYTYYGVYANEVRSHIREDLRSKMRYATSGDVIIVGAGENKEDIGVGVAWYGDEEVAVHDACYTLSHKQNPKYISYFLRSKMYHQQIVKYVYEGKICSISAENVGKALIPIPSIEEQDRIVSILDRFDKVCTDLLVDLPAEIEARKKQYEYYRDKLLSFNAK